MLLHAIQHSGEVMSPDEVVAVLQVRGQLMRCNPVLTSGLSGAGPGRHECYEKIEPRGAVQCVGETCSILVGEGSLYCETLPQEAQNVKLSEIKVSGSRSTHTNMGRKATDSTHMISLRSSLTTSVCGTVLLL